MIILYANAKHLHIRLSCEGGFLMKKIMRTMMIMICCITLLSGCYAKQNHANHKKMNVYASFYPMYDFAKKIGGDFVEVKNMTPAGSEPHDYEPSMEDMKGLSKADMFIYNGDDMEHWAKSVIKSVDNKNLSVVRASDSVTLLHAENKEMDPHTWLSIKNAIKEMQMIKEAFIKKDPEHKDVYEKNYTIYHDKLVELDTDYTTALKPYKGRSIVVAHQAFGYLCNDYGIKQIPIEGLSPDSEPDPVKIKEIIQKVKDNNIKVIFYEELVNPKVAKMIADETGVQAKVLNTLEGLSDSEQKEGRDYISVMKENLENLKYAFGQQ